MLFVLLESTYFKALDGCIHFYMIIKILFETAQIIYIVLEKNGI
jgi:hypothetical protein